MPVSADGRLTFVIHGLASFLVERMWFSDVRSEPSAAKKRHPPENIPTGVNRAHDLVVRLFDWCRAAQVAFLHGHATAAVADKFHGGQLVLADMFGLHLGSPAKTAFFLIPARVAQMTRRIGDGAAAFTRICHCLAPFS